MRTYYNLAHVVKMLLNCEITMTDFLLLNLKFK